MKTRQQKQEELKKIQEKLKKAKLTALTSFSRAGEKGLSVAQMRQLKRDLRGVEADYLVAKKTIVSRALKEMPAVDGSIGMMFSYGDPYAAARALYQFAKKNPVMKLFGDEVMEMALMPSREVLIGRLVGMLSYPIRGLAVALDQISKKNG